MVADLIPKWLTCARCSGTLHYSIIQREDEEYEYQLVSVRPCGCRHTEVVAKLLGWIDEEGE